MNFNEFFQTHSASDKSEAWGFKRILLQRTICADKDTS